MSCPLAPIPFPCCLYQQSLSAEHCPMKTLIYHFSSSTFSCNYFLTFASGFRFHEILLPDMTEINFIHNTVLRFVSFSLSGHETIKFLFHLQNCGIAFIQHFSGPGFLMLLVPNFHLNQTIVAVKIPIPKVKTAVLKKVMIFGKNSDSG